MPQYYGWGLPFNASAGGAEVDRIIFGVHILMFALFIGWSAYLILALFKFRARSGHQATYKQNHFKAPTYAEVAVALFEVLLLVGFSFPIVHKVNNAFPDPKTALHVRVVAEQFAWSFHYPGDDGIFGKTDPKLMGGSNPVGLDPADPAGKDDIVTINQMHVPVNKPVIAQLSSKDVIHSFGIPVMRVKQDAIPGQSIPLWFEAAKTGNFEIACAQLCGLGHYRMRGFFIVEGEEDFKKWLNSMKPPEPPAAVPAAVLPPPPPPPAIESEGTVALSEEAAKSGHPL